MLRFLNGTDLNDHALLCETMFRDRARQFRDRLGWSVTTDARGWERDEYDDLNPLYVIWQRPDGRHGGSMRFLPTMGRTMVNEHFSALAGGRHFAHRQVWECTRFCLGDGASASLSAALMLGGAQVGKSYGLTRAVGVFDARMVRIYRRLGWEPTVLGSDGAGRDQVSLGLWSFSDEVRQRLARRAGIPETYAQGWFDASPAGVQRRAASA